MNKTKKCIWILRKADCVIKPDVQNHHWADFTNFEELIQKGRTAVFENINQIKRVCSFWHKLKKGLGIPTP
ncbi:MAG: hypothetical protein ACUVTF_04215 [bacterium]